MDNKKKYNEALERARVYRDNARAVGDYAAVARYENIFPELRESEDEKIRKELLDFVRSFWTDHKEKLPQSSRWVTYLEKQKEPEVDESTKRMNENWMKKYFENSAYCGPDVTVNGEPINTEPKQVDITPAEWSEDWREEDIRTRFAFYTYKDDPSVLYLSNVFVEEASRNHGFGTRILKAAEKVAEAIGATTICLKVKQDSPANAWYRKNGYSYAAFEDDYDWLQKNLEYLNPAKQEWSKEDDWKRKELIQYLEEKGDYRTVWMTWLKSLRPQPHWKPSEEQMEVDLEKEFNHYCFDFKDPDTGEDIPKNQISFNVEDALNVASHFAQWGAEHLKK